MCIKVMMRCFGYQSLREDDYGLLGNSKSVAPASLNTRHLEALKCSSATGPPSERYTKFPQRATTMPRSRTQLSPSSNGPPAAPPPPPSDGEGNKSSAFVNKPPRGWLHSDLDISEGKVQYCVRYIGCLEVTTSMKSLDFETRSQIAKECINRVCEAAGLKTVDKKRKVDKRLSRMLSDKPNMDHAGSNVTLSITSLYLNLITMDTNEVIARHDMPNISFASGGDSDTLDFVAYVAKDHNYGRACFVLECGGGLAQTVITTVGQAFELRFKEFLKRTPRFGESFTMNGRRDDPEYYNDLPGKVAPDGQPQPPLPPLPDYTSDNGLRSNHTNIKEVGPSQPPPPPPPLECQGAIAAASSENLIDLSSEVSTPLPILLKLEPDYVNTTLPKPSDPFDFHILDHSLPPGPPPPPRHRAFAPPPPGRTNSPINGLKHRASLLQETWFHGPISRKDSEALVIKDGDFLVRESQGSLGQYVLTGIQGGQRKHLLLVDPEGVVRTKDRTFESVAHLVNYHKDNGLPIISAESSLILRNAIPKCRPTR